MEFDYLIADKKVHVAIDKKENKYQVRLSGESFTIEPLHFQEHFFSFNDNDGYKKIMYAKDNGILYVFIDGLQYRVEDLNITEQKSVAKDHLLLDNESEICAPMPGKILKIFVTTGDQVTPKQNLLIVEAMKMENSITSSMKGVVKKINFKEGDLVDTGQPIIELEAAES